MKSLKEIESDPIILHKDERKLKGLDILSLKIALKSYFSTYYAMKGWFIVSRAYTVDGKKKKDFLYSHEYYELYSQTIIYFHHFFELYLKNILRKENELLVIKNVGNPITLLKLLNKEELNLEEYLKQNTVEFSEALEIFKKLKEKNLIDTEGDFSFIDSDAIEALKKLNQFRNRLIHRGSFIIRYKDLDDFIGGYILPLVLKATEKKEMQKLDDEWGFKELSCGINTISEIIKEIKKDKPDYKKIAFLKELTRASYNNPIAHIKENDSCTEYFYARANKIAEFRAKKIADNEHYIKKTGTLHKCPVCGIHSLVTYLQTELEDVEKDDNGNFCYNSAFEYTTEAKCMCCGFNIYNEIENPKEYGYDIEDIFEARDL